MSAVVLGPESARLELSLPRDQWQSHPRFATQTLLLGSHANFLKVSRQLLSRAESGSDAPALRWVFRAWKSAMHSHEHYEERKLYPYLTRRWDLSFEACRAGHAELSVAEAEVLAESSEPGPATAELVEALRRHDEVLVSHLALEEELVIPALLALEPAEFEAYLRS